MPDAVKDQCKLIVGMTYGDLSTCLHDPLKYKCENKKSICPVKPAHPSVDEFRY